MRRFLPFAAAVLCWGAALAPLPAAAQARVVPQSREQVQFSFAPVVRQVAPAVVNVFTRRVERVARSPLLDDPFFRRFFGDDSPTGTPRERVQRSLGSGVIVRPEGVVVTNHHVIKDADQITVVLNDRREFAARAVRSDERTDLAVLQIDAPGERLPYLELRDSDDLEVGDMVLAIGNPFGVGQTVTSGIISGLARTNVGVTDYGFFIQTDAAINPGNSGGALVTLDGRLAGVNTAIFSRSGGSIGIGFAIPSNMVRTVLHGGTSGARVIRPWLGASGQAITADLAHSLGLARPRGVLIGEVTAGSPAAAGGLRTGDIVLQVDGRDVDDPEALRFRFATLPLGGSAHVRFLRDGRELSATVPVLPPPEDTQRSRTTLSGNQPFAGADVANLSPALAEEIGYAGPPRGVVILEVRRGTTAARLGFAPGDVIREVNGQQIATVQQLQRILGRAQGQWRVAIRRGDQTLTATFGG
ncbi:MAG: DegQ family serine endoprotease [Alphaproteobacteria bacterium]|nr:DegQ family serine endoprotease [Alphaproteobacteria bacterium]